MQLSAIAERARRLGALHFDACIERSIGSRKPRALPRLSKTGIVDEARKANARRYDDAPDAAG